MNVEGEVQSELESGLASRRPLSFLPASSFFVLVFCIFALHIAYSSTSILEPTT